MDLALVMVARRGGAGRGEEGERIWIWRGGRYKEPESKSSYAVIIRLKVEEVSLLNIHTPTSYVVI